MVNLYNYVVMDLELGVELKCTILRSHPRRAAFQLHEERGRLLGIELIPCHWKH